MKKHILAVALLIGTIGTVHAQDAGRRAERAQQHLDQQIERLDQALDLSDAQQAQIRAIFQQRFAEHVQARAGERAQRQNLTEEQRRALREQRRNMTEQQGGEHRQRMERPTLTEEQRAARTAQMERMRAERERTQDQIRAVLTPEQLQRFEVFQAQRREEMKQRTGEKGGERRRGADRPPRGNK